MTASNPRSPQRNGPSVLSTHPVLRSNRVGPASPQSSLGRSEITSSFLMKLPDTGITLSGAPRILLPIIHRHVRTCSYFYHRLSCLLTHGHTTPLSHHGRHSTRMPRGYMDGNVTFPWGLSYQNLRAVTQALLEDETGPKLCRFVCEGHFLAHPSAFCPERQLVPSREGR